MAKDEIDPSIPKAPECEQADRPQPDADQGKIDPAIPKAPASKSNDDEESAR